MNSKNRKYYEDLFKEIRSNLEALNTPIFYFSFEVLGHLWYHDSLLTLDGKKIVLKSNAPSRSDVSKLVELGLLKRINLKKMEIEDSSGIIEYGFKLNE